MRGQSLKQLVESNGYEWTVHMLNESMQLPRNDPERLRPEDFSIRELAEAFCGEQWVRRLDPRRFPQMQMVTVQEAGDAVDVSAFSNITGQIFFNKILEGWDLTGMIGDKITETIPTELDGEKMPFLSRPLTEGQEHHDGMPFQEAGLAEEYITTPRTAHFGQILSIFRSTIFFDRTGQMLRQANKIGEQLRMNKERRILNTLVGAASAPQFIWKGVTYTPYQTAGTYWTNDFTGTPLVDWVSIEKIEVAATQILDPDLLNVGINSPIEINLDTLIVMPFKKHTARRVVHATELRSVDQALAPNQITIGGNTLDPYEILVSKILYRQAIDQGGFTSTQAQDMWWMIDQKRKPLAYMENWPLKLLQAPPNSQAEFERDIVFRVRADERGTPAWLDPRYAFRVRNT